MSQSFRKIFIANRGEIALRAIRTCREMGIPVVAAYSDCDRLSLHVKMADEAVHLGPSPSPQSYLAVDKILAAAKSKGCDAIYPGYGFLAENADFAEACESAGMAFIGPSADVIRKMGDKEETRRTLDKAGIPIVPGREDLNDAAQVVEFGQEVGWPVLIKAAAGGGGKGMQLVHKPEEAAQALQKAQSVALKSFGDGRVYVEKFVANGRHIEIQFLADSHGNVVHLGERECSIQRSHQKLVEETPSPVISSAIREAMGENVRQAVGQIGYVTAGTMEFLFDESTQQYYAIEVNTRIQVEHTVTEMITGYDLIRLMIETKAGQALPFAQEDVQFNGHALQCRINAEDVAKGFVPSIGTIQRLEFPSGPFVRIDSGIYQGWEIPMYYDSMMCKLCVWAPDRATAIERMRRALDEFEISGVKTTIPLHQEIMKNEDFRAGHYNTGFIPKYQEALFAAATAPEPELDKIAQLLAESTALGRNQHCF